MSAGATLRLSGLLSRTLPVRLKNLMVEAYEDQDWSGLDGVFNQLQDSLLKSPGVSGLVKSITDGCVAFLGVRVVRLSFCVLRSGPVCFDFLLTWRGSWHAVQVSEHDAGDE